MSVHSLKESLYRAAVEHDQQKAEHWFTFIFPDYTLQEASTVTELKEKFALRYRLYEQLFITTEQGVALPQTTHALMQEVSSLNLVAEYIYVHHVENVKTKTIKDNQLPIFLKLYYFLESGRADGYVWLPTGSGKTVIYTELIEAILTGAGVIEDKEKTPSMIFPNLRRLLKSMDDEEDLKESLETPQKIVILVPRKKLVSQTYEEIQTFAQELDAGQITSSVSSKRRQEALEKNIIITTYQSISGLIDSGEIDPESVSLLILDETHRALGTITRNYIEKFTNARRIGFTATPNFSQEHGVHGLLDYLIAHVDTKAAVAAGMLCSFSVIVAETTTDLSSVKISRNGDYVQEDLERAVNIESRNKAALDLYRQGFTGKKGYFFCAGVQHAKDVAKMFTEAGIPVLAVSGDTSEAEMEEADRKWAAGEIAGLACADLLIEGDNRQDAEFCFNLASTRSAVRVGQRAGRALRNDPNNSDKHAFIVDFVDQNQSEEKKPLLYAEYVGGSTFIHGKGEVPPTKESIDESDQIDSPYGRQTFERLWNVQIDNLTVQVSPTEVLRVVQEKSKSAKDFEPAPEGYMTENGIADHFNETYPNERRIYPYTIEALARRAGVKPAGIFLDARSRGREHYSPESVEIMKSFHEKLSHPPAYWRTLVSLANELGRKKDSLTPHLDKQFNLLVQHHSEETLSDVFYDENGYVVDYFAPLLYEPVLEYFNTPLEHAPMGWWTVYGYTTRDGRAMKRTSFLNWLKPYRTTHPEWFQMYALPGGTRAEHISPELIAIYEAQKQSGSKEASGGAWEQANMLAEELSISRDTLLNDIRQQYGEKADSHIELRTSQRNFGEALFISAEAAAVVRQKRAGAREETTGVVDPIRFSEKYDIDPDKVMYWVETNLGKDAHWIVTRYSTRISANMKHLTLAAARRVVEHLHSLPPEAPSGWGTPADVVKQVQETYPSFERMNLNYIIKKFSNEKPHPLKTRFPDFAKHTGEFRDGPMNTKTYYDLQYWVAIVHWFQENKN